MTDFKKILDQAKELETKMKESQEKIKNITAEGVSGSNSVKITLNGDGEMIKIEISNEILKEDRNIIEDLIIAAHNNSKAKSVEISSSLCFPSIISFKNCAFTLAALVVPGITL